MSISKEERNDSPSKEASCKVSLGTSEKVTLSEEAQVTTDSHIVDSPNEDLPV